MTVIPTLKESAPLRYSTFFYLYFMQGVPSGFALTAIVNYLVAKGISSTTIGTFISVVGIPWVIQLIWGPLIDRYRYSVVGHYKHWVLLTQLAAVFASLGLLMVGAPEKEVMLLSALFFFHSLVASVQDASVDAMAISLVPDAERGRLNAFMRGGMLLGLSFGAAALSTVLHQSGFAAAVWVQSGILLFFTFLTFIIKLERTDPLLPSFGKRTRTLESQPSLSSVFRQLRQTITRQPHLRIFVVIFLSYFCFGVFIRSLNFYLIRTLHWSDNELSVLQGTWGSLLTLAVILGGGYLADKLGAQKLQLRVLLFLALFLIIFNVLAAAWVHKTVVTAGLLIWSIADPLYSVAAFPILMMLCHKQIAGSQFTAYMAMINLSDIGGAYLNGWALQVLPAPVLGASCGFILLGLFAYLLLNLKKSRLNLDPAGPNEGVPVIGLG